jgi:hypothetical protein
MKYEIHRKPAAGGSWRLYDSSEYRAIALNLARSLADSYPGDSFGIKQPGPVEFESIFRVSYGQVRHV